MWKYVNRKRYLIYYMFVLELLGGQVVIVKGNTE